MEENIEHDLSLNLLLPSGGGVGGSQLLDDSNLGRKILLGLGALNLSRLLLDYDLLERCRPNGLAGLSEHLARGRRRTE